MTKDQGDDVERTEGIRTELDDGVLTVTIDRPDRRNALTPDQFHSLGQVFVEAEQRREVRVVVLRGVGESFCAGADLADADLSASGGQVPPVSVGRNLYLPLLEFSKPLIGAINGVAAGGGLGLALCCDLRIASDRARFATSFTRIGITANDTVAYLLPRIVGVAKALELLYIPDPLGAEEAERIGLVTHVVGHDELDRYVDEFVARIAAGPPVALQLSKRLVIDGLGRSYREHVLAQEYSSLANRVLADHDIQEGVAAFLEKREPSFRGLLMEPRWENY